MFKPVTEDSQANFKVGLRDVHPSSHFVRSSALLQFFNKAKSKCILPVLEVFMSNANISNTSEIECLS